PVKKIILKSKGVSTLSGRKIWYDDVLKRLNADGRGKYLGEFDGDDKILTVLSTGVYELTSFDLNNHFDDKMILIEKYKSEKVYTVVHIDGKTKNHLVKRFTFENTAIGKQTSIISDEHGSKLVLITGAAQPVAKVVQLKGKGQTPEDVEIDLSGLIDVKGMKAMGNRLSQYPVKTVELIDDDNPDDDTTADDDQSGPGEPDGPELTGPANPASQAPEKSVQPTPKSVQSQETKSVQSPPQSVESPETKSVESPPQPVQSPPKKIDFEITNPDDIEIDDKGQLGLF